MKQLGRLAAATRPDCFITTFLTNYFNNYNFSKAQQ